MSDNRQWRAALMAYAPLVFWIAMILFFSGGRGSVDQTSGFFQLLLQFLVPVETPEDFILYYGSFRKIMHFVVYAVLGFLAFRAFAPFRGRRPLLHRAVAAIGLSLAVALTDEFLQSLDHSRTGTLYDVAIDMAGAASMIFVIYALRTRREQRTAVKTSP